LSGEGGQNALGHLVGISLNSAGDSGGGIYATNDSFISGGGIHKDVVKIDHNTANTDLDSNGDGGGVYLSNNSVIVVYRLFIHANKVVNGHGGGLYLDDSEIRAYTLSNSYNTCLEEGHIECNLFSNNSAVASVASPLPGFISLGSAIYMRNNSRMTSDEHSLRARFINNAADNGSAIGLYSQSTLDIQGSYFINNGDGGAGGTSDLSVFAVSGGDSVLDLSFSTMANNISARVFQINNFGTVNLFGSIVYEAFDVPVLPILALGGNSTFNFGCSIFHENESIGLIPNIGGSVVTQNPGFISADSLSPESSNYHLRYDSIAIDRCNDNGFGDFLARDSDLDIRGLDFPGINNGALGNFDAGADEVKVNDLIFADGFEM